MSEVEIRTSLNKAAGTRALWFDLARVLLGYSCAAAINPLDTVEELRSRAKKHDAEHQPGKAEVYRWVAKRLKRAVLNLEEADAEKQIHDAFGYH